MAAMEELEALLQSLQALKPPGVTKTKIDAITAKCVENVQVCRLAFMTVIYY
jgi:protein NRD1